MQYPYDYNYETVFEAFVDLSVAAIDCSMYEFAISLRQLIEHERKRNKPNRRLINTMENAARHGAILIRMTEQKNLDK